MEDLRVLNIAIQAGSFGLLALLIVSLLRYYPRRVKEMDDQEAKRQVITERLQQVHAQDLSALQVNFSSTIDKIVTNQDRLTDTFRSEIKSERDICANQFKLLVETLQQQRHAMDRLTSTQENMLALVQSIEEKKKP